MLVFGCAGSSGGEDPSVDPACQLNSQGEKSGGFPFSVTKFTSEVAPVLKASCLGSGCHNSPSGLGGFNVWPDSDKASGCDLAKTFNDVAARVDLTTPANSKLLAKVNGNIAHSFKFNEGDPGLAKLTAYVADAVATLTASGGGGVTPGPGNSPFDYAIFQSDIQPAISAAGCAVSGCHLTGARGFFLKANPAAGSADMEANFVAITARASTKDPAGSVILFRATNQHAPGSTQIAAAAATKMLDWITKAKAAAGGSGDNTACAPADTFNQGVFNTEILPILNGDVDLNEVGNVGRGAGCTSTACHGRDIGPGTLNLTRTLDKAKLLENFACFVNLATPSASEIIMCPLNLSGCRKAHPGENFFRDGADKNFQRILGFIYGGKAASSPHDFAFFARKINPIFDDENAVQNGEQGLSCTTAQGCHGIQVVGAPAPGGSDFPIIADAGSDPTALSFNFVAATGFVNFLNARESSLFLYPTDEIVKLTGSNHPGGPTFAVDSQFALDILTWATGLRPDAAGFANNWLVLGDFAINLINDQILDESTLEPKIFQRDGGSQFNGTWEPLFSANQNIDLNALIPADAGLTRAAYAASYLINTDGREREIQIVIKSPNALRVYVDGALKQQAAANAESRVFITLGAQKTAKILIKILQAAQDVQFAFTAQLQDENDNVLTDSNSGLVFTLGPTTGGI